MAKVTHRTIDPETGHTLAHYKSGVIRDLDTARNLRGPTDPALNPILSDPAAMRRRRYDLAEAAAWEAANRTASEMIEAGEVESITIDKLGSVPVIAAAASKATRLFLRAKTGREAEGIGAFLLKLLGLGAQRMEVEGSITHKHEPTEALTELAQYLRKALAPPEAIEGVINDESNTTP